LAYTGAPVTLDELLFKPDSSLVRQAYDPQQLHMLNLGGFGMVAWDPDSHDPSRPYRYGSTELPVFDPNLKALAEKVRARSLLAHIRGIAYRSDAGFGPHNLHPFQFAGHRWAMAHNGDLAGHVRMKHDLLERVRPVLRMQIRGTTDSETMYALVMSALSEPAAEASPEAVLDALIRTLDLVREVRARHGIEQSSSMNLFFSDATSMVALRYTFDFGCYATDDPARVHEANLRYLSLWYTAGEHYGLEDGEWRMTGEPSRADSVLVASEPLTRDITGWVEVPEYSALVVDNRAGDARISTLEVAL
jgi:predicted glutamine amidotransferase